MKNSGFFPFLLLLGARVIEICISRDLCRWIRVNLCPFISQSMLENINSTERGEVELLVFL